MDDVPSGPTSPAAEADPSRPGSSATRALARAGLIVTVAFAASRVLGYARYVVMAAVVPDASQLDAFFAAFRIPDFLFQLVAAGALSSALIPILSALFTGHEAARAWRVVSTVSTLMLSALLVLSAVVLVAAPVLVPIITPGFDAEETALTVQLTRIMVLSPLFLALGAVATSVLNARGRFGAAALAPLVYNLAIIGGALVLVPVAGVAGLAVSVVLGSMGHLLVQLPTLRSVGARIRPLADVRDAMARKTLALMAPRALGLGGAQVVFLVMTSYASMLGEGAIASFTFAFAVLQIPIGVIGVPLGVVLLPSLSREAALGASESFRRLLVRGLRILAFVMIPIAAVGIVVSGDIVRLLFDYGQVDEQSLAWTGQALAAFLVGLTAHSLIAVLARAFYAQQDTKTPVIAALLVVVLDIALATVLVGPLGVTGLALAMALGAWTELGILSLAFRRRNPGMGLGEVAGLMVVTAAIAAAAAAVAFAVQSVLVTAWGEDVSQLVVLVRLVVSTAAGAAVFLAGAFALRMGELRTIVGIVADLIRRRGRA